MNCAHLKAGQMQWMHSSCQVLSTKQGFIDGANGRCTNIIAKMLFASWRYLSAALHNTRNVCIARWSYVQRIVFEANMRTDNTSSLESQTTWDSYYMNKPTDINAMYPTTESMMAALEEAVIERRVTWIARVITALIFIVLAAVWYVMYPELAWAVMQYV